MSMTNTIQKEAKEATGLPTVAVVLAVVAAAVIIGILAYKTLRPLPEVKVQKDPLALIQRGRTDPNSLTPHEKYEYGRLTHGAPLGQGTAPTGKPAVK